MTRTKHCVPRKAKYKKVFKMTSGFRGASKNCIRVAKPASLKAMQYSYVGRKIKKREYKNKFVEAINASARLNGISYSEFVNLKKKTHLAPLSSKVMYEVIDFDGEKFDKICSFLKGN